MKTLNKDVGQSTSIVFTHGCFDVLHNGHFKLFEFCRKVAGEGLVLVGLNSDLSIKRLKGESRPIFSEKDRKFALESLKYIDEVIIFHEDTPYELIKTIRPNYIIKGGDYKKESVIGGDIAEVIIFNLLDGYSTSSTMKKL